jgi:hypothetical protein
LFFHLHEDLKVRRTSDMTAHSLAIFEDRYGTGSYERLMAMFDRPCVTFAEIAGHFGVSRERVRQWHRQLRPDAPRGHARQRVCVVYHQKRRLLEDSLFRSFYQHARPHVEPGRIALIPTREGFRRRVVRLDGATVVIRAARRHPRPEGSAEMPAYVLTSSRSGADFVYYKLSPDEYLLVPASELPAERTTFFDTPGSRYQRFKNNFGGFSPGSTALEQSA